MEAEGAAGSSGARIREVQVDVQDVLRQRSSASASLAIAPQLAAAAIGGGSSLWTGGAWWDTPKGSLETRLAAVAEHVEHVLREVGSRRVITGDGDGGTAVAQVGDHGEGGESSLRGVPQEGDEPVALEAARRRLEACGAELKLRVAQLQRARASSSRAQRSADSDVESGVVAHEIPEAGRAGAGGSAAAVAASVCCSYDGHVSRAVAAVELRVGRLESTVGSTASGAAPATSLSEQVLVLRTLIDALDEPTLRELETACAAAADAIGGLTAQGLRAPVADVLQEVLPSGVQLANVAAAYGAVSAASRAAEPLSLAVRRLESLNHMHRGALTAADTLKNVVEKQRSLATEISAVRTTVDGLESYVSRATDAIDAKVQAILSVLQDDDA